MHYGMLEYVDVSASRESLLDHPDLVDHRNSAANCPLRTATPKALRTSSQPGQTRTVPTRLKICPDPLVYAYDSPGVMLPFIGKGDRGAERGVKLALIGAAR